MRAVPSPEEITAKLMQNKKEEQKARRQKLIQKQIIQKTF